MMVGPRTLVPFLILAMLAGAVGAQEEEGEAGRVADLIEHLEAQADKTDEDKGLRLPEFTAAEYLDEQGRAALTNSVRSYYEYKTTAFSHRQRVFEWQLLSSKVIFVVVIFLVLTGIYFSWLQFRADLARRDAGGGGDDASGDGGAESSTSTIEASAKGIKVSSPVLGVIILVISLMFFYLYLQYVYPIEELL